MRLPQPDGYREKMKDLDFVIEFRVKLILLREINHRLGLIGSSAAFTDWDNAMAYITQLKGDLEEAWVHMHTFPEVDEEGLAVLWKSWSLEKRLTYLTISAHHPIEVDTPVFIDDRGRVRHSADAERDGVKIGGRYA